jgi:hypothetical protein
MNKLMLTGAAIVAVGLVNLFVLLTRVKSGNRTDLPRSRHLRIVVVIAIPVGILLIFLAGHWGSLK